MQENKKESTKMTGSQYIVHLGYKDVTKYRTRSSYLDRFKRTASVLPNVLKLGFYKTILTNIGIPVVSDILAKNIPGGQRLIVSSNAVHVDKTNQYISDYIEKHPETSSIQLNQIQGLMMMIQILPRFIPFQLALSLIPVVGYAQVAYMGFTATKLWFEKDVLHVHIDPKKMNIVLDETARLLGGERTTESNDDDTHYALYQFGDVENNRKNRAGMQDIATIHTIHQRLKNFMHHLPSNVFVKYIYKIDSKKSFKAIKNDNENINEYIMFPRNTNVYQPKQFIIPTHKLSQVDLKIVKYADIQTKRYTILNDSPKIIFWKDYLPYKFIKKNFGLPRHFTTPEFTPLKLEYYDFWLQSYGKIELNGLNKMRFLKIVTKTSPSHIVVRITVTINFDTNLKYFLETLPKNVKIVQVTSKLLESKDNECDYYQVIPLDKKCSKSVTRRPREDKLIYTLVNKRERLHWW